MPENFKKREVHKMNKKLISFIIAGSAIISSIVATADATRVELENTPMLITENPEISAHSAFVPVFCKITAVEDEMFTAINTETEEEILINKNYLQMSINADGEMIELAAGDEAVLYVREDTPMLLSLPAQYSPTVIVKASEKAVDVDNYKKSVEGEDFGDYTNQAGTLAIHVSEETEIIKLSREMFDGNLDGFDLVVIYDVVAQSLPAQTNPTKIIVLNKAQQFEAEDETFTKIVAGDKEFEYIEAEGAEGMIPVRAIAEALGFTVQWDANIPAVMINNGMFTFAIGEDHYTKGKMMPISLGQASVCVPVNGTGITHVPFEFFTEVLGVNAQIEEGTLTFTLQ